MLTMKNIKNNAKLDLQGYWGLCVPIAALNIFWVPLLEFSSNNLMYLFRRNIELIYNMHVVAAIILGAAFALGAAQLFLSISGKKETDSDTFFSSFDNIFRAFVLNLLIWVFVALWSVLLIVPGIIAYYRYRMAFYILSESPEISPLDAIRISKKMTDNRKWDLFMFDLSFLGWLILVAVTAGLAGLYVFPYYNAAMANYYKELKIEYVDKRNQERCRNEHGQEKEGYRSDKERENHTWNHN